VVQSDVFYYNKCCGAEETKSAQCLNFFDCSGHWVHIVTLIYQKVLQIHQLVTMHRASLSTQSLCRQPPVNVCLNFPHRDSTQFGQVQSRRLHKFQCRRSISVSASADDSAPGSSSDSLTQLQETAALDELIDLLLQSRTQEELAKTVAENALSFDQKFWLRVAARTDTADEEGKDQLRSIATTVMQIIDAMVQQTDEKLSGSSEILEQILIAGADEDTGEWMVPLAKSKVVAMKDVMVANADSIDEALLSSCFAWMKKASDDKLEGMVYILQTVLQIYASMELGKDQKDTSEELVQVLQAQESEWEGLIKEFSNAGKISEESFMEELQKKMEKIVLSLSSGSYAQRVQAEYLKELQSRAKNVFDSSA
jgi:flagellar biosynthesis regulator FlaF